MCPTSGLSVGFLNDRWSGVRMVSLTYRRPFISLCLTGALLVGQLSACTSWRVQNTTPQQFSVRDSRKLVRIVRLNGTRVTLNGARVSGDTLYGTPMPIVETVPNALLAIPLSEVRMIEVRQGDTVKTVGLVLGISALVAGAFFAIWAILSTAGGYGT